MQIKLERRLLFSLDPLHPNILISANIPSLSFDLDLPKLRLVRQCPIVNVPIFLENFIVFNHCDNTDTISKL